MGDTATTAPATGVGAGMGTIGANQSTDEGVGTSTSTPVPLFGLARVPDCSYLQTWLGGLVENCDREKYMLLVAVGVSATVLLFLASLVNFILVVHKYKWENRNQNARVRNHFLVAIQLVAGVCVCVLSLIHI